MDGCYWEDTRKRQDKDKKTISYIMEIKKEKHNYYLWLNELNTNNYF